MSMRVETERLLIRPWRHADAERLLDILSRLEVVRWLGDGEPVLMKNLDEAHTRINRYAERDDPPLGMWGEGYASEAARAVLAHGFAGGLPEIIAVSHTDNDASKAVMRRIGMTDRGVVEKWYEGESAYFAITAEEWFRDRR